MSRMKTALTHTTCALSKGNIIRPRSVNFTDGGFFSGLFNAVGRSKKKKESNIFF